MDKITNNFFHSQTNSTTELGHSPPFLVFSRKLLVNGFLIMINYIYNQLYNLQGWFVMVSDCEELVGLINHTTECVTDLAKSISDCISYGFIFSPFTTFPIIFPSLS